jgi:hypothetical protein
MSTRGCIARNGKHEGTFAGRYNHSDSYPSWMGPHLWKLIHKTFRGDAAEFLTEIVDKHPAGWSVVGEECYCHPKRNRASEIEESTITEKNADSDIEWVWAFDAESNRLYVRDNNHKDDAGIVDLSGPEPTKEDWTRIECGENLERCSHYAWVHGLLSRTSNLSTQTWLGNRPLEFHDAVAFIVNGKRLASTGCGGNSDFFRTALARQHGLYGAYTPNTWVASVKAKNGKRIDAPVAKILSGGKYVPLPEVVWIFPPTKPNPNETQVFA